MDKETAMQALQWLTRNNNGIGALRVMMSADQFKLLPDAVQFHFHGSRKVNICRLEYNSEHDLFNLVLLRGRKEKIRLNDMFGEDLAEMFNEHTGLSTIMPRFIH